MRFPNLFLFLIAIMFAVLSVDSAAQNAKIDSLIQARSKLTGLERARITQYLALEYVNVNLDSAAYYAKYLEDYIAEDYDKQIDAFALKIRGWIAEKKFEYEKSMEYRNRSFELFKELGNFSEMGWVARGIGMIFYELGNYASATEYYILGLSAFETYGSRRGIADIHNRLGTVYYATGHSDKAMEYYNSSIQLFREIGYEFDQGKAYNNIGIILYERGQYLEAMNYYNDALDLFFEANFEDGIASVYANMALSYSEMGQLAKALEFTHLARKLAIKNKRLLREIGSYINIGSFHCMNMNLDSSEIYLEKALRMAEEYDNKPLLQEAYNELAKMYEAEGDFEEAYIFHVKYFDIRTEIHHEDSELRIEKLMTSYEQRLRQQEMDLLTSDQKTKSLINKVFGALIIVSVILLFIMVYGYTSNKKKNKLLVEKNIELNEFNDKLIKSEEALKTVIDDKNKLFTIIAHDLRNPVAAVSGFSELLFDNFDQLDVRTQKEYVSQVIQGSTRTFDLLENLLLWARSQMDSIVVKKAENNVRKLVEDSLVSIQSHIQRKEIDISISVECNEFVYADYEMMKAVLRNLITNAVKFSFPGGLVEVKCFAQDGNMQISVIDQGIGIEPEISEALFIQNGGSSTPGTSGESGSGLGLMICKDYTERNGGSISVNSKPGSGSAFTVVLPLKGLAT